MTDAAADQGQGGGQAAGQAAGGGAGAGAAGAGAGAGGGAAPGTGGAGAGAGGTGAGAGGGAGTGAAAGADAWLSTLDDPGKGLVAAKGWKSPADAVKSYANLEKLVGADKLALPAKDQPLEQWEGWAKLGRPDAPTGYEFDKPQDMASYNDAFVDWFRGAAHTAGLPVRQASLIHDAFVAFARKQEEAAANGQAEVRRQLDADIARQWGGAKAEKLELAKRAMRQFGYDDAATSQIEATVGSFRMLDALAKMGALVSEDTIGGGAGGASSMSPERAQAEIQRLKADPEFSRKYLDRGHVGHSQAVAEMERLHAAAYPKRS